MGIFFILNCLLDITCVSSNIFRYAFLCKSEIKMLTDNGNYKEKTDVHIIDVLDWISTLAFKLHGCLCFDARSSNCLQCM